MEGMASRPRRRPLICAAWSIALLAALLPSSAHPDQPPLSASQSGKGEPTIVLIHGIGQDRRVWNRVAPALERRFRVVRVDLPGHGQSAPVGSPTVTTVAQALDRTLREKKVRQAVLVGHSYGALVALEEAAAHPDRVGGIVAIDMATFLSADPERIAEMDQFLTERYALFLRAVFGGMTRDSSLVDSVVSWAGYVSRPVLSDYFRDAWSADLRGRIQNVKAPILLILTDAIWPWAESWTSARTRLGYETAGPTVGRRIGESGHLMPLDQPDSLSAAIEGFASALQK